MRPNQEIRKRPMKMEHFCFRIDVQIVVESKSGSVHARFEFPTKWFSEKWISTHFSLLAGIYRKVLIVLEWKYKYK